MKMFIEKSGKCCGSSSNVFEMHHKSGRSSSCRYCKVTESTVRVMSGLSVWFVSSLLASDGRLPVSVFVHFPLVAEAESTDVLGLS